jgi:type I protein arginine methyltransferase
MDEDTAKAKAAAAVAAATDPKTLQGTAGETSALYYFDCFAHFGVHEELLKDEVRINTFHSAISCNKHLFHGKVVLHIGAGVGVLSMFAAKAGAKHVYATEPSAIARQARRIVEANGFKEKITIIEGKIEEIVLPVEKVFWGEFRESSNCDFCF